MLIREGPDLSCAGLWVPDPRKAYRCHNIRFEPEDLPLLEDKPPATLSSHEAVFRSNVEHKQIEQAPATPGLDVFSCVQREMLLKSLCLEVLAGCYAINPLSSHPASLTILPVRPRASTLRRRSCFCSFRIGCSRWCPWSMSTVAGAVAGPLRQGAATRQAASGGLINASWPAGAGKGVRGTSSSGCAANTHRWASSARSRA